MEEKLFSVVFDLECEKVWFFVTKDGKNWELKNPFSLIYRVNSKREVEEAIPLKCLEYFSELVNNGYDFIGYKNMEDIEND